MSAPDHPGQAYSRGRFKLALAHFAMGKVFGLTIGFAWMLMLVRALPSADYGSYVAFTGAGEILQLALSFGLVLMIERYLPELRLHGHTRSLRTLVLRGTALRAVVLAGGCALLALSAPWVSHVAGLSHAEQAIRWYLLGTVCEGIGRYAETVFDSLLLQSRSQISILTRYGLRAVALAWFYLGGHPLDLLAWVKVEAACQVLTLVFTMVLLWRSLPTVPATEADAPLARTDFKRYLRYVMPAYLSDLVLLMSWIETAKILVVRLFGPEVAAVCGFCITLAWMLQRYLPTYLLIGMLRPMFVAAAHDKQDAHGRLRLLFDLLVKLNIFVMVPAIVVGIMEGDAIVAALSGQRFMHGGTLFFLMLLLVLTQALRMTLVLVASVFEDGHARLWSTVLGNVVFLAAVVASMRAGAWLLVLGLVLADIAASAYLAIRIRGHGLALTPPVRALSRTGAAAIVAAAVMVGLIHHHGGPVGVPSLLAYLAVAAMLYLATTAWLQPFESRERELINSLIPGKVFIW